jgi:putative transposase
MLLSRSRTALSAFNSLPSSENGTTHIDFLRPTVLGGAVLLWTGWRGPLVYVQADTVVRWQRERFRRFWAWRSSVKQRHRGRPATAVKIRRLIERMVAANPPWRAPRIHGELKMLGIEISERTVSRIFRRLPRPPGQTWKTLLHNHLGRMVSIDFFTVPTITLKLLFVFIVMEHRRRQVLHFNVTDHPTAPGRIRTPSGSSARSAESV